MVAVAGPFILAATSASFSSRSLPGLPYIVSIAIVLLATWLGDRLAGVTAVVDSALALDYGWAEPVRHLALKSTDQLFPVVIYVFVALLIVELLVRRDTAVEQAARDRARLSLLHRTNEILIETLDVDGSVPKLASYLVEAFGDWVTVDVLDSSGGLRDLAVAYRSPADGDKRMVMAPRTCPPSLPSGSISGSSPEEIAAMRNDLEEGELPLFAAAGPRSALARPLDLRYQLVVPVMASGGARGVVTLARGSSSRRFEDQDIEIAFEIANRVGVALETATLYEGQQEAARRAEEDARRSAVLQAMTAAMGRSESTQEVVDATLSEGILAAGAKAGVVGLVDWESRFVRIVGSHGFVMDDSSYWRGFGLDDQLPLAEAIRSEKTVVVYDVEERDRKYPAFSGRGQERENHLTVCTPLKTAQATLGGIAVSFAPGQTEDPATVALLEAVADQAALAIDRSLTHQAERVSRTRFENLATASRLLSLSLEFEETASKVAELAAQYLGERAVVYLTKTGGVEPIRLSYRDPERGVIVEEALEWPRPQMESDLVRRAIRTRKPVNHVRPIRPADQPAHSGYVERSMILPLVLERAPFGALVVTDTLAERGFDEDEVTFAEEIVRRMARAIEHARAYRDRDEVAQRFQESLLPPVLPQIPNLRLSSLFRPAMRRVGMGGDFYDVFETTTGRWAVAIGDVCGKGLEAAVVTSLVRHTLRAGSRSATAGAALRLLNEVLLREDLDGRFVTACFALLDPKPEGTDVDLAVAGHPLPRLIEPEGGGRNIGEPGTLLGIVEDPKIGEHRFRIEPGSTLLLYTDGLIGKDAKRAAELERVEESLIAWGTLPPDEPLSLSYSEWQEFEDDVALLALLAEGSA